LEISSILALVRKEDVATIELDRAGLEKVGLDYLFLKDRDLFEIK
jgi:hypothetical protein